MMSERRFPLRAALWLYLCETEEWRLVLAVPKIALKREPAGPVLQVERMRHSA
jgi:hypothetical protein